MTSEFDQKNGGLTVQWWVPIAAALIGAIGAVIAAYVLATSGDNFVSDALPTVTVTATETVTASGPTTGVPTEPVATPTETAAHPTGTESTHVALPPSTQSPESVELALSDSASREPCKWPGNSGNSWNTSVAVLGGQSFPSSLSCRMRAGTASGYVMYLVPERVTNFSARVGIDEQGECSSSMRFEVLDGFSSTPIGEPQIVRAGQPGRFEAGLTGVSKIALKVQFDDVSGNPRDESCVAVWANPLLIGDMG